MVRGLSMGHTLPTRTRSRALSLSPFPSTSSSFSSFSRKHARALTRSLRSRTTDYTRDDAMRIHTKLQRIPRARYFFLASSAFFSLSLSLTSERFAGGRREDRMHWVTTSSCVRFLHGRRRRVRCVFLGKTFSKGTCENHLDRAHECEIKLAV